MSAAADVLVVGAGPSGLTLACQLARRGVPHRLIELEPELSTRSRAIGMSPRSLEAMHEIGAAEDLIDCGVPAPVGIFFSRGRRIGRISFERVEHVRNPFMLALPQYDTETVLERHLERLGGSVDRGVTLRELRQEPGQDGVSVVLDGPGGEESAEASWLVGTDGSHSAVRKLSGIGFEGRATGDVFVSVDADVSGGPPRGEGHYHLSPEGMFVVVPLGDGLSRITASITSGEGEAELEHADVQALADRRVGGGLKVRELRDAGWGIARVRIQARLAESFHHGRCLLAGDAAHIYGPTGAQGMNGGIQDAHALAWRLALVTASRGGHALLDGYDAERRPVARGVLRAVNAQTRMATVSRRPLVAARDAIVGLATRAGALDRKLAPEIGQLEVNYRGSPEIAAPARPGPGPRGVGRRVPDTPVVDAAGVKSRLYDVLLEQPFTVLVLGAAPAGAAAAERLAESLAERHGDLVALHALRPGALDGELRVKEPTALLVRPDQHLAYRGPLADPAALLDRLARFIGARRAPQYQPTT